MFLNPVMQERPMKKLATLCHEQSIIPIQEGEEILQQPHTKKLLQELQTISQLEDDPYTEIYSQLVVRFFNFVQMVPDVCGGRLGALFDEGLKRAALASRMQHAETGAESDSLMLYAVFSAALLLDLRKILVNKRIMLTDASGGFVGEWLSFSGFMQQEEASHYQVRSYHRPLTQISPYSTVLLAYRVMPEAGFLWLARDVKLLTMWMSALCGEEEGTNRLLTILQLAKMQLHQQGAEKPQYIMPIEITQPPANALAEEFWAWLKNKVAEGSVDEAAPAIHVAEDLVFLDVPKIFQEFCKETKKLPVQQWQTLYQQFMQLGIATAAREEDGIVPPEQLMIYLTKEEMVAEKQKKQKDFSEIANALPKGFFKQMREAAKKEQANKHLFEQAEALQKEQALKETTYKQQESILAERGWFNVSNRLKMEKRLRETAWKRKRAYRGMVLKRIIGRLMLKRTARTLRRRM